MSGRSLRQTLHRWHGWLGVYLFSLLAVVFLSGTLAVFGHELDWLLNEDIRNAASYSKDQVLMPGLGLRLFARLKY